MKQSNGQTLCETEHFIKVASVLWSVAELDLLKDFIAFNPGAGDEIPGTGGLRKLRWSRAGMGKRGGARVIYYFYNDRAPIYLLHAYKKAAKDDLTPLEKASLTKLVDILKARLKQKE
jgi:hypothetical protein